MCRSFRFVLIADEKALIFLMNIWEKRLIYHVQSASLLHVHAQDKGLESSSTPLRFDERIRKDLFS